MNFLDSIQRREVIDEDKKIHKRALDSEFAFIQRIGEDTLPPTQLDKRVGFSIMRYIQQIANNLQGAYDDASAEQEKGERYIVFDLGSAISVWNELIIYMKTYRPAERLSTKDYDEFWTELNDNVLPIANNILILYDEIKSSIGVGKKGRPRNEGVVFVDKKNLTDLIGRIENKNLSTINTIASIVPQPQKAPQVPQPPQAPAVDIAEIKEAIEAKLGDELYSFFHNPDEFDDIEKEERRLYRKTRTILKKLKVDDSDEAIREIFTDIADDMDIVYPFVDEEEEEQDDEEDEGENEEGAGKPKRRMNKKKMGEDELQLEIEFKDAKGQEYNDKKMKKAERKKQMLYDDSKDSNYLK